MARLLRSVEYLIVVGILGLVSLRCHFQHEERQQRRVEIVGRQTHHTLSGDPVRSIQVCYRENPDGSGASVTDWFPVDEHTFYVLRDSAEACLAPNMALEPCRD
jgi:hypothetical protein